MKLILKIATASIALMLSANTMALNLGEELQKCADIEENQSRLSCFDALAEQVAGLNSEEQTVAAQPAADMDSTIGGSRFVPEEEREQTIANGRVSFCQQSYDKKYLFIFENGQVWKQSKDKRYRLKDCGFDVNIGRDFFGFYMEIQGEKAGKTGKIRIKRLK